MSVHQSLLELVPAGIVPELTSRGVTRPYDHGQMIHTKHADSVGLSIVMHGRVRFGLYTEQGAFFLTAILGEGHCYGEATLFADRPRAYHAEAFGSTEVLFIGKRAFNELYNQHPKLARAITTTVTQRLYESLDFADDLRHRSLEQQIARLLLRIMRTGRFSSDELPLRQTDLAFSLGVSRVSVGKAVARLQSAGVLVPGYGAIRLTDTEALAAFGRGERSA